MKYLSFSELRTKLGGRARSTIYRDVSLGRLPKPLKLGSRLYWIEDEVDAAVRTVRVQSVSELPDECLGGDPMSDAIVNPPQNKGHKGYIPVFNHYAPIYAEEAATWSKDIAELSKARKFEKKLLAACERRCTEHTKFKHLTATYLRSLRCLQVAMLEDNKRRPMGARLSLREIIEVSKQHSVLSNLDELAEIVLKPKSDGGFRPICLFGPVARGAQRMVLKLLRMTYQPVKNQFTRLGVAPAVLEAMRLIREEGYSYVAEVDIINHYPSFDEESLVKSLPLPKRAVQQIVMACNANWSVPKAQLASHCSFDKIRSGIPQGSSASSEVASWSVSHFKMNISIGSVVILNYADNFFVLAKTKGNFEVMPKALDLRISKLPGGSFKTKLVKWGTAEEGFPMLGVWLQKVGDDVIAEPTKANANYFEDRYAREEQSVKALLTCALKSNCSQTRKEGVSAYVHLEAYVKAWTQAFSFCQTVSVVHEDKMYYLKEMISVFEITNQELKEARKYANRIRIDQYGHC